MNTRLEPSNKQRYWLIGAGLAVAIASSLAIFLEMKIESPSTLAGYEYRRSILVNTSHIDGERDLDHFAALLVLEKSWVRDVANGGDFHGDRAGDIAFTEGDGITLVPFEIKAYDPQLGKLSVWIHLDRLRTVDTNQLYIYYGGTTNSGAVRNGGSSNDVSLITKQDEARQNRRMRSEDWGKAGYINQSDSAQILTVGGAELMAEGLPVTWVSQEANWLGGRDIELTWETNNELNNDQFLIERRLEGEGFEVVGTVDSKGDAKSKQLYVYHDLKPSHFSGSRITYRIRQVGIDGQSSRSPMIEALIEDGGGYNLELYPNPFTDVIRIEIPESSREGYQLSLRHINGSLIQEDHLTASAAGEVVSWYPPEHIPSGSYMLELLSSSRRRYTERIVHR